MAGRSLLLIATLLSGVPHSLLADDVGIGSRPIASGFDTRTTEQSSVSDRQAGTSIEEAVRRFGERLGALRVYDILVNDERARAAEGAIGLGLITYGSRRSSQRIPILFIGVKALLIGLGPQFATIHQRFNCEVEPEIGSRGFAVVVKRTAGR